MRVVMRRTGRVEALATFLAAGLSSIGSARAADETAVVAPPPVARFTASMLFGTGYGWSEGTADLNADIPFSGGSTARLGHAVVEAGVLFPRVRLFLMTGPRLQVVTGTTDLYDTSGRVYRSQTRAYAWFGKVGWLPLAPEARLQPYVAASLGYGEIRHLARLTTIAPTCGPNRDQTCVDTVTSGPYFVGAGGGLRWRFNDRIEAVVAVEAQLGEPDRTLNIDLNLGFAIVL